MSEAAAYVYVDLEGTTHLVGRLWNHQRQAAESATFEYDDAWLTNPACFAFEPALQLGEGAFHTSPGKAMFGAIGDSAPDRWGRVLMRRAERRRAEIAGRAPRTLMEIDYLLRVSDESRQGAFRFCEEAGGPFVSDDQNSVPPLIELPRLLSASERIVDNDSEIDEDLRLLLAPGSSLGGARPKASVRDRNGDLAIAKFPHKNDDLSAVKWEAVALDLARNAGISVPHARIELILGKPVLILRRFDRISSVRVPFLSAMSMIGARDNEMRSYMEIMDAIRQHGSDAGADGRALWKRIVFNILISNTDDHLRNHGFLFVGQGGWSLAPAYDMNPVPIDVAQRELSTAIDLDDATASLDLALSVAPYFELDIDSAYRTIVQVAAAVGHWRDAASRLGIAKSEIDRMSSAFEHEDSRKARAVQNQVK